MVGVSFYIATHTDSGVQYSNSVEVRIIGELQLSTTSTVKLAVNHCVSLHNTNL